MSGVITRPDVVCLFCVVAALVTPGWCGTVLTDSGTVAMERASLKTVPWSFGPPFSVVPKRLPSLSINSPA